MSASNDRIAVVGSSSKVYYSLDGQSWGGNIDLNNALEGGRDIAAIHFITNDSNGNLTVGADDMHLYYQNYTKTTIEDLEDPDFDMSSSSSDSSGSSDSSSSG
jgi:hypothetical protein